MKNRLYDLTSEYLVTLPMQLETITISGGSVSQQSWLGQANFNNQVGGDCKLSGCAQTSVAINADAVTQTSTSSTSITSVIEDNRRLLQLFGISSSSMGSGSCPY